MAKLKGKRGKTFRPYRIEDGITQSMLACFVDCRVRCAIELDMWRAPKEKDALIFGSLWHWMLQCCYETIREKGKIIPFKRLASRWMSEFAGGLCDLQSAEKHIAMAAALFDPYWKFWREDFNRNWIDVEKQFDVEWKGFRLRGMRDGGYTIRRQPWILETKTASQISEDTYEEKLAFDFQNLFYKHTAEIELGKLIKGVLYNLTRKPGLRQGKAESLPAFATRMKEDVLKRPEWYFNNRYEINYSDARMDDFRTELLAKLIDFKRWGEGGMCVTYKNEQACIKRWNCEFLSACAQRSMAGYVQNRELFSELGGR